MMRLKRFRALTRSYGADLERWPQEERAAAKELSASSEEARALLEEERLLDRELAAARAHRDVARLPPGMQDGALARLRSGVAARIAAESVQAEPAGWHGWLLGCASRISPVRMRRLGFAATGVFAIIAGLLIGGMYGPASAPAGALSALLQPATLDILAD